MRLGLIGGTGLNQLPALGDDDVRRVETRWGEPSAPITLSRLNGLSVAFLPRHGSGHRIPPHAINYRANIQALADTGVDAIIGVAAVGGISAGFNGGSVVVPDQLVDYSWGRAHSFWNDASSPMLHIEFEPPYDAGLRAALLEAAGQAGVTVHPRGTYAVTQGPRLETAAEIRRLARDGCDIVGMTGMPEAALAKELGIPYASLAMVVNAAAGTGDGGIHDEISRHIETATLAVTAILEAFTGMHTTEGHGH